MKIYTVYNGKLYNVDGRETKKMVIIDNVNDTRQDGCYVFRSTRFKKDFVCTTPEQAIQEAHNRALTSVGMREDHLKKAKKQLHRIEELKCNHEIDKRVNSLGKCTCNWPKRENEIYHGVPCDSCGKIVVRN